MRSKIKMAFEPIRAEETLKQRTAEMLAKKTKTARPEWYRPILAAALSLALVLGGYWLYFVPTVYISIDINPSIELSVNRFDRVLSVNSRNADGAVLAQSLNVRFLDVSETVDLILQSQQVEELLSADNTMTITVIGEAQVQCDRILHHAQEQIADRENIDCYTAHHEEVADAHEAGLSYGKYQAFLELQELDPEVTPEDVQGMTMKEIRDTICQHNSEETQEMPDTTQGHHGNGKGHGDGKGSGKHGNTDS